MKIQASPLQVSTVRLRFEATRTLQLDRDGVDIFESFPKLRVALDALPEIGPCFDLAPELRALFEVAFADVGVAFPARYDRSAS